MIRTINFCLFLVLTCLPSALDAGKPRRAELVVFTQPRVSPIGTSFSEEHLPAIESLAAELDLELRVVNLDQGAPEEVTVTPLIVFQNYRGRSIFQGRYTSFDKLRNFVRVASAIPLTAETYQRRDVAVWRHGRAVVVAPIKITDLAGSKPEGYAREKFISAATHAIMSGFSKFRSEETVEISRTDRLYYMDFYPHRSEDGTLHVSLSLFSQFNCVNPIFQQLQTPFVGQWRDFETVFAEAGRMMEAEVFRQIATSRIGDGFTAVDASLPIVSWQKLGLTLPSRNDQANGLDHHDIDLPMRWHIAEQNPDGSPRLHFRFPPPLDAYAGEVTELTGALALTELNSIKGATGWIEAKAASVTMGDKVLDEAIYSKMLKVSNYPHARFSLEQVEMTDGSLQIGSVTDFTGTGSFQLRDRTIPLQVRAQAEPLLNRDSITIRITATWRLKLMDNFNILGPDGPAPQNDTLEFYLDVLLRPVQPAAG